MWSYQLGEDPHPAVGGFSVSVPFYRSDSTHSFCGWKPRLLSALPDCSSGDYSLLSSCSLDSFLLGGKEGGGGRAERLRTHGKTLGDLTLFHEASGNWAKICHSLPVFCCVCVCAC